MPPASKKAEQAINERNDRVWGFGNAPFVVTAKGALRIRYLVADLRGRLYKDLVKELQVELRAAAKDWRAIYPSRCRAKCEKATAPLRWLPS